MLSNIQQKLIAFLLILAFAMSPVCFGLSVGGMELTPTTVSFLLAALLTAYCRLVNDLPVLPKRALTEPAVWSAIIYFSVGLASGVSAVDKPHYLREIVQRTIIIWLPFYAVSMGFRKMEDAKNMFLAYIPFGAAIAGFSAASGISSKFETPVYILGLHKNMTAGLCATMAIICVAYLITKKRAKIKLKNFQIDTRIIVGGALALGMLGIVAAQGRAAVIEVLVGTYVILIAIKAKPSTLIKVAVCCLIGGFIVYKLLPEKAIEHVVDTSRHSANAVRVEMWTTMAHNFMKDPLLAVGWGNCFVDDKGWAYYDLACVFLFDYMQMGFLGAAALVVMIVGSVVMGVQVAMRVPVHSTAGFVSLTAAGLTAGKFVHGMLDTFWIARGHNLQTWMAIGAILFVKLWVDQNQSQLPSRKMIQRSKALAGR